MPRPPIQMVAWAKLHEQPANDTASWCDPCDMDGNGQLGRRHHSPAVHHRCRYDAANQPLTRGSSTHSTGVWSPISTVTGALVRRCNRCVYRRSGFSYDWSSGSPASPPTATDPHIITPVPNTVTTTVDSQTFPNATWPAGWTRSDATYVRLTKAAGAIEVRTQRRSGRTTRLVAR